MSVLDFMGVVGTLLWTHWDWYLLISVIMSVIMVRSSYMESIKEPSGGLVYGLFGCLLIPAEFIWLLLTWPAMLIYYGIKGIGRR